MLKNERRPLIVSGWIRDWYLSIRKIKNKKIRLRKHPSCCNLLHYFLNFVYRKTFACASIIITNSLNFSSEISLHHREPNESLTREQWILYCWKLVLIARSNRAKNIYMRCERTWPNGSTHSTRTCWSMSTILWKDWTLVSPCARWVD